MDIKHYKAEQAQFTYVDVKIKTRYNEDGVYCAFKYGENNWKILFWSKQEAYDKLLELKSYGYPVGDDTLLKYCR